MAKAEEKKYKIESGIPVPRKHYGQWSPYINVIVKGQSVLFEIKKEAESFYNALKTRKLGACFRTLDNGTFRVWRTE